MERRRWISLEFYIWLFRPKLGEVLMHIYKFEFENGKLVILASEVLVWHQILLLVCAFSSVGAHVYLLQIKCLFTFHFFHFFPLPLDTSIYSISISISIYSFSSDQVFVQLKPLQRPNQRCSTQSSLHCDHVRPFNVSCHLEIVLNVIQILIWNI